MRWNNRNIWRATFYNAILRFSGVLKQLICPKGLSVDIYAKSRSGVSLWISIYKKYFFFECPKGGR